MSVAPNFNCVYVSRDARLWAEISSRCQGSCPVFHEENNCILFAPESPFPHGWDQSDVQAKQFDSLQTSHAQHAGQQLGARALRLAAMYTVSLVREMQRDLKQMSSSTGSLYPRWRAHVSESLKLAMCPWNEQLRLAQRPPCVLHNNDQPKLKYWIGLFRMD